MKGHKPEFPCRVWKSVFHFSKIFFPNFSQKSGFPNRLLIMAFASAEEYEMSLGNSPLNIHQLTGYRTFSVDIRTQTADTKAPILS
jgi:hypothetical protein